MLNSRSKPEWMDLLELAQEVHHSILGAAIREELTGRAEEALVRLESPKTDVNGLFRAQGERKAYKRDMMILEDLVRQARAALKPKSSEEQDA